MPENLQIFCAQRAPLQQKTLLRGLHRKPVWGIWEYAVMLRKGIWKKIILEKSSFSCLRVLISLQGSFNYTTQPFSVYVITMENKYKW